MAIGGIFGAGLALGFILLATKMHVTMKGFSWADALGSWLGVSFFGIGIILFAISFNRRELADNLEFGERKLPATDEEVRSTRLQAATMALAGAMLLLLTVSTGLVGQSKMSSGLVFGAIAVLFGLQTWANVVLWRNSDEFLKGQILLSGALTFAIGQGALFLWAAAEHLRLARPASSWDVIVLLLTLYLLLGSWFGLRARMG